MVSGDAVSKLETFVLNSVKFQSADYVNLVNDKVEIEHHVALMTNNRNKFLKKWSGFKN